MSRAVLITPSAYNLSYGEAGETPKNVYILPSRYMPCDKVELPLEDAEQIKQMSRSPLEEANRGRIQSPAEYNNHIKAVRELISTYLPE